MTQVSMLTLTNQSLLAAEAWSNVVRMFIAAMALIDGVILYGLCLFMVEAMRIGLLELVYDVRDIGDILYAV